MMCCGDAGLPVIDDSGFHGGGYGFVEVRAGHHHKRIAAAQFQHHLFHLLGRAHAYLNTGALAAGERRGHDARIRENALDLV